MIVTIDGPAGAGKSTIARQLAARMGFRFLDTGAMYRAATLAALQSGADLEDAAAVAALVESLEISVLQGRTHLGGQDVSQQIRSAEVTAAVKPVADNPAVRTRLVELQRQIGELGNLVTEGRDQGTVAFPHAACKFYLTASPEERARRRMQELHDQGEQVILEEILQLQNQRDHADESRQVGRLEKAADTIEFLTDGLTIEQVVAGLERIVREKMVAS
jgi:CMP/dCMP kinase